MKTLLLKSKFIFVVSFLFLISGKVNAQCTITGPVLSSSRTCSSFASCPIITIGDGVISTSLILDNNLDLTVCSLGPIQLIVNSNANIDFSDQNYDLRLPAGSSITFNGTGTLLGPESQDCSNSDRIFIGGIVISTCKGAGDPLTFPELVAFGGTGSATSNSPVCVGSSINLSATPPPNGGPFTYTWYEPAVSTSSSIGTEQNISITSATAGSHIYQVKMYSESLNKTMSVSTTVVVNGSSVAATLGSNGPICSGSDAVFTITGAAGDTVTYTGAASGTATIGVGGTVNVTVPGVTANTTLNITNVNNGICNSSLTGTSTVTVRSLVNNIGDGFSSSSFCEGSQATITFDANNGSGVFPYTLIYKNDTTNATASVTIANDDSTPFNIIPNPITTTHYTLLSITDANNCVNSSPNDATAEATILLLPSTPTVGIITQPTCSVPTGSVVLSGLPSGNWTINPGGITGSTTSTTVSGLAGGAYNFTVTNASGCISDSAGVSITALVTNTYTGTWSAGSAPPATGGTQNIVFDAGFTATTDLSGCSCQINSGVVIINSGKTMTITNAVTVSVGGSLTFENNASLVQINDAAVNTGDITYRRITTPIRRYDYTYWSSPVAGFTLGGVSPNTLWDKFYSFDPDLDDWKLESSGTVMKKGMGYIIRGPQTYSITEVVPYPASFVGVPNNGVVSITGIVADESYLLGNPYPSALDADAFLEKNDAVLDGTLYFWTHNTAIQPAIDITNGSAGSGIYAYTSDDYASYNRVGGVAASAISDPDHNDDPSLDAGKKPTGKIASGQGFFASSKVAPILGSVVLFNNGMRVGVGDITGVNSQFFKGTKSSNTAKVIEKNRIWLNLTNTQGAFKQTLIGYVTNATNGYDNGFDGESFDGNQYIDFYSVNQDMNLVIQGRALPFDISDKVPLGYKTTIAGTFSISIDQADGLLVNQAVFIKDKDTGLIHNLKEGAYSFITAVGVFNDRFELIYSNNTAKSDIEPIDDNNLVLVSAKEKEIAISSFSESIQKVLIYDLSGRLIYQKNNLNSKEHVVSNLGSGQHLFIVKISLSSGKTVSKEIIY